MKQGAIAVSQPHLLSLSLAVPLPIERSALAELAQTLSHLDEFGESFTFEILLIETAPELARSLLETTSLDTPATRVIPYTGNGAKDGPRTYISLLLSGLKQARGDSILVLEQCPSDSLPSVETIASMLLAAKDADLVVASRYLPGADERGRRQRLDVPGWLASKTGRLAAVLLLPRLRDCTDLGSGCFLAHRRCFEEFSLPAEGGRQAPTLLMELLVRSPSTGFIETPYRSSSHLIETPYPGLRRGERACAEPEGCLPPAGASAVPRTTGEGTCPLSLPASAART